MKNAYYGYSYQHLIAILAISRMDVERKIDSVEIEVDVDNHFDDVTIHIGNEAYFMQMKDIRGISMKDIVVSSESVKIKGKRHKLSEFTNILICKEIDLNTNCEVLGLPAFCSNGLYIVSLNRSQIQKQIESLYRSNLQRKSLIDFFFQDCLDKRKLSIKRSDLPIIQVFKTNLLEETVNVGVEHLKLDNILVIEGKPGVGKSHLVSLLQNEFRDNLVYRFWTSNQDKDYEARLKYDNFIFDLSKKLFQDMVSRSESEIISKAKQCKKTIIVDGLDHVENYNQLELDQFIKFLEKLKDSCKLIILSRPLKMRLDWKKYTLRNWNRKQTDKVLDELYHISKYEIRQQIFDLTHGYPILVKYVAEFYKKNSRVPPIENISSVDNYYDQILARETGKRALSLFLCFRAYVMKSEINVFLGEELAEIVEEFINEHPYLFEIRLNRVSLFHDSLITYLRHQNINYTRTLQRTNNFVYDSIMAEETRFLSRYGLFQLDLEARKKIIQKYSCIEAFKRIKNNCVDFEALQAFYSQLILQLNDLSPDDLEIPQYYDLSLISNITYRDHASALNGFYYTYVNSLLVHGYSEDDITSSRYMFAMLYYIRTNDSTFLFNITSDSYYSTEHFHRELDNDIRIEESFFRRHKNPLSLERINEILAIGDTINLADRITFVLTNIYLHETHAPELQELHNALNEYLKENFRKGLNIMIDYLDSKHSAQEFYASMILRDTRETILSLGKMEESNEYNFSTLKDLILNNEDLGSFDLFPRILAYMRLALHEKREIDISSISLFWTKYYQRKDYTLFSVPNALKTFEDNGMIDSSNSVRLIDEIQFISEKGYRSLLNDYLELHAPEFIIQLEEQFDLTELSGLWFKLPPAHIDSIPDRLFNNELRELIKYNRYDKEINFDEVKNVLKSSRKEELKNELTFLRYSIRVPKSNSDFSRLQDEGFIIIEDQKDDDYISSQSNSEEKYNRGTLNRDDIHFIKEKLKTPQEFAGFDNGYYATLADLDLYLLFDREQVTANIKQIIYNAILGKVGANNSVPSLYHFPGNVPKLLADYEVDVDFKKLFNSFNTFLQLSSFSLSSKKSNSK